MKSPHVVLLFLALTLTISSFAQGRPGSGSGKTPAPTARSMPSTSQPQLNTPKLGRIAWDGPGEVEGCAGSATGAQGSNGGRKAFETGRDQQKKQKWDDAQRSFEKAVEIYPKYAVAWFELGRVKFRKTDEAGAREAFNQALNADSKFVSAYQWLAELAMRYGEWQDVVKSTDQILALNPVNFPDAWFQNSVGNYSLTK